MKGSDVRTGFYLVADKYNLDSQSVLENDEYLGEIYAYPEDLLVDPVFYLHGACDMFALFLAKEYEYGIRAYYTQRQGYQNLLVHAVCWCLDRAGSTCWIDIRGITDDEAEMLAPFDADILSFQQQGYDIAIKDYAGDDNGIDEFIEDFVDPNRDVNAFMSEISGLMEEDSMGIYAC